MDLYDLSPLKAFCLFAIGRLGLVFSGGEAKKVKRVTPDRSCLLRRFFRVDGIFILLEIAVGVVAVVVSALVVVERLGTILGLGFYKSSKKHSEGIVPWVTFEKNGGTYDH